MGAALLAAVALLAPGAMGMLLGRGQGAPRRVVQALAGAALATFVAAAALRLFGLEPTRGSFAIALLAVTLVGGAIGARRGGRLPDPRRAVAASAIFVAAFALAAWSGLRVVPPLEDQDSEVQGTANGLLRNFEPFCLTNRSTLHYFAHPPLLHVFAASTLTLAGELPAVRPPYDAAYEEWWKLPPAERRGFAAVSAALRGDVPHRDYAARWARDVYGGFLRDPALLGTRTPNFVLAGVVAALLFLWMRSLRATAADAALVVAAYATLPEIVVRSGYGGYYAIGAATWLAGVWLSTGSGGGGRAGYLGGVLGALADQKTILLGVVVAVTGIWRCVAERSARTLARATPFVLGVAAGTIAFWVYGFVVAPHDFVVDHVREHLFARVTGHAAAAGPAQLVYPSPAGLWTEFAQHFGPWTVLAALALGVGLVRARRRTDVNEGANAVLVAWVVAVAIAFTLTDWRQTKHLALLVPAASMLIGIMLGAAKAPWRWAIRAGLVYVLVWNVGWVVRIAKNFDAMSVSTLW